MRRNPVELKLNPFAVFLIKAGQFLCTALGMEDKDVFTLEQFVNQLEPNLKGEEILRELNGIELESAIMVWSASAYASANSRHKQWNPPTQKLIMDLTMVLQKVQFWHLADWIENTGRKTSQFWGLRRYQNAAVWVTREPTQQEKLHDGMQKLHDELGINIINM
jgi:hypothetical protein